MRDADRRSQDRVAVRVMWAKTTGSGSHQKASSTSPYAPYISVVNLRRSALLIRASSSRGGCCLCADTLASTAPSRETSPG